MHISPEIYPLNKVGGLGDVAFELPLTLNKSGRVEVVVIAPLNSLAKQIVEGRGIALERVDIFCVPLEWRCFKLSLYRVVWDVGFSLYLIGGEVIEESPPYPARDTPFYDMTFPLFSLGCIEVLVNKRIEWFPDLIHIHDWPTCLLPIFSNFHRFYRSLKLGPIVLSIHNIAYQGIYESEVIERWHLLSDCFTTNYIEFWGKVNLLKGGINLSNAIVTVSPSYAEEIKTIEFGFGLDGVIRENGQKLIGITNGIDQRRWDPSRDENIPCRFNLEDLSGKKVCKERLLEELSMEKDASKPLLGMISRVVSQKGFDILIPIIPEILNLNCQMVILGSGDPHFTYRLKELEKNYSFNYRYIDSFDETLARKLYAGSDFLLMPSWYEPCGISQMIALKYGTLPIARRVGGLKDTIRDISQEGWGFLFEEYKPESLLETIKRALEYYNFKREALEDAIRKGMNLDFSWEGRIDSYIEVYKRVIREVGNF